MTLRELKDEIDELCYCVGNPSEVEVKVGIQKHYPLRTYLNNICIQREDGKEAVWLAIGDGVDYAVPKEIWENCEV